LFGMKIGSSHGKQSLQFLNSLSQLRMTFFGFFASFALRVGSIATACSHGYRAALNTIQVTTELC
jgi:hypothetical protein